MHRFTPSERQEIGRWLEGLRKERFSSRAKMDEASKRDYEQGIGSGSRVGESTIQAIENGARSVSDESWTEYLRLIDLTEADVLRHRGVEESNGPEDPGAVLPFDPSRRLKFKDYPPEIRNFGLLFMRWLWMLPRQERREEVARIFARMAVADEDDD